MRTSLFALLLLTLAPAGAAQVDLESGTVTVVGTASATAAPDLAVVRLGVQTRAATPAEALRRHEADMARVLAAVRAFGIADRHITIEGLGLGENYGPEGPDGFLASRIVAVETDSLRIIPDLIAAVVEVGANRLDGLFYTTRDATPLQERALDEAVARARRKAERLAAAAGVRLGAVVAIAEQGVSPVRPFMRGPMDAAMVEVQNGMGGAEPGAYSTGTSRVDATVVVRFAIGP